MKGVQEGHHLAQAGLVHSGVQGACMGTTPHSIAFSPLPLAHLTFMLAVLSQCCAQADREVHNDRPG